MENFSVALPNQKARLLLETTSKHDAAPVSMGMQKTQYDMALEQFQKAADIMKLDPNVQEILRKPRRILSINFPVKMDDGRILLYQGFRSQHNNALGPYKGGIRFHPNVTIDEVKALSLWMTWSRFCHWPWCVDQRRGSSSAPQDGPEKGDVCSTGLWQRWIFCSYVP